MIHLHCHTVFSVGDGVSTSRDYASRRPSVLAMTDHDNMSGLTHHFRACREFGVKPIYGVEITTSEDHHLTLLAMDESGLKNLFKLGASDKTYEDLLKFRGGVLAMSGDLKGAIPQAILRKDAKALNFHLARLQEIYGQNFYLEVIDHGLREQASVNAAFERIPLPKVRTNDVHYLDRDGALTQAILICDRLSKRADLNELTKYVHQEAWLKPMPEDAIAREIAEKCDVKLRLGEISLPTFTTPRGSESEYLNQLALEGLARKVPNYGPEYLERLRYELDVISSMGFSGYYLIVWDFVDFAHKSGITVGPGRGSGAGSLVSYALDITDADPIRYELLFERFLNPERVSMPDFDIDFSISRREEVIRYVVSKYGESSVCQIATFSELKQKSAWQSAARISRVPFQESLDVGKMLESGVPAKYNNVMELADRIEGRYRAVGCGAAGLLISDGDLTDYIPAWDSHRESFPISSSGMITRYLSQVDKTESEKMGLVKFDFLGLAELDVIDYALKLADLSPEDILMDDPNVFDLITSGHTLGIFQLKSHGMSQIVQAVGIESFEDIVAVISLFRPGPLDAGMHWTYANRKNGLENVEYLHEDLAEVLGTTYGVIIYQEQVMQISRKVGGFTLGGADILRRAMGKKDADEMERQHRAFLDGGLSNGYSEEMLLELWRQIETFAGYGFNRSHAVGYGLLVYRTAWLKTHYPAQLLAAQMQVRRDDFEEVAMYIKEAERLGIEVPPPSVNTSPVNFNVVGAGPIMVGLSGLKGLSIEVIKQLEVEQPFRDLADLFGRVDMNKSTTECLAHAGAFDEFLDRSDIYQSRADLVESFHLFKKFNPDQGMLFDLPPVPIIKSEPIDAFDGLLLEREMGGRFITGHPASLMPKKGLPLHKLPDSGQFTTSGFVVDVHEILTKRGEFMAFMSVQNAHTTLRFCLFSDIYEREKHLGFLDELVVIQGSASHYNGEVSPIIEEVEVWRRT